MPSRTTGNGRSLVSTWRRTGMSSTCSDATGFPFFDLAAAEPCPPGAGSRGSESGAGSGACRGGADDVEDEVGVRQHGDVAAVDVVGGGTHPLGRGPLQIRVDGLVVVAHDGPGRRRPPRDAGALCRNRSAAGAKWVA